jgi:hypothetical protein
MITKELEEKIGFWCYTTGLVFGFLMGLTTLAIK